MIPLNSLQAGTRKTVFR